MIRDSLARLAFVALTGALLLVAAAGPARAEKDPHAAAAPAAKAAGHDAPAGHGDDKLGFIDIKRYDLGIYTLLVFGLLYLFIQVKVWPRISEGLRKREAVILGARDEALKARQEAEDLRARLQKEGADAQDKIRAMLDDARRDADALRAAEKEAGAKDAQAERERARKEIEAAKEAALQDLYQQAVQLASVLSAKTIRRELSPEDHRRLLDESLAELKGGIGKA